MVTEYFVCAMSGLFSTDASNTSTNSITCDDVMDADISLVTCHRVVSMYASALFLSSAIDVFWTIKSACTIRTFAVMLRFWGNREIIDLDDIFRCNRLQEEVIIFLQ